MNNTRHTAQRRLVLDIMRDNHTHPAADDVYDEARRLDPHISRGTVYRNLNFLAENGEIQKITIPDGPDRFDCSTDKHYHFCCRICGRVYDLSLDYNPEFNHTPKDMSEQGFITQYHRLMLVGLCPECSAIQSGKQNANK